MTGLLFRCLLLVTWCACGSAAGAATIYVDPSDARSSDGGHGAIASPLRSLAEAMRRVAPGDTVNIAPGVYREPLILPRRRWSATAPTLIQGSEFGEVLIKGSRVLKGWSEIRPGVWAHPLAEEPQQVFVDGRALRQIGGTVFGGFPEKADHSLSRLHTEQGGIWPGRVAGSANAVSEGMFFFDREEQLLIIGVRGSPSDSVIVEASLAPVLMLADDVEGLTIRRLSFQHAATTSNGRRGAIAMSGRRLVIEKVSVRDVDGIGLTVAGEDVTISDSRFDGCGQLGINARGVRFQLLNNQTNGNNTRGFNKWWEAGGAKFIGNGGLKDSRVVGHTAIHNLGDGLWFDWGNERNRIERSVVAFNSGFGIHYEASSQGTIVDNVSFGNGQRGIYLMESRNSLVAHNFVAMNQLEGIAIVDEGRRDSKLLLDLRPRDNVVAANIIAWNRGPAVILPGRSFSNRSIGNLFLTAGASAEPLFAMGWPRSARDRLSLASWRADEQQDVESEVLSVEPTAETLRAVSTGIYRFPLEESLAARRNFRPLRLEVQGPDGVPIAIGGQVGPRP